MSAKSHPHSPEKMSKWAQYVRAPVWVELTIGAWGSDVEILLVKSPMCMICGNLLAEYDREI